MCAGGWVVGGRLAALAQMHFLPCQREMAETGDQERAPLFLSDSSDLPPACSPESVCDGDEDDCAGRERERERKKAPSRQALPPARSES